MVIRVEKPWGHEIIWACTEKYVGKILNVLAGHALSRQYHQLKDETMYISSGEADIEINGTITRMGPGSVIHIPPGTIHRVLAVTDVSILEASTPELDDVVRLEDRYGR